MSDNNSQKYSDLGNEIRNSVMDAINSGDYSGLSESINKSVYTVLGDVGDSINKAATRAMNGGLTETQQNYRDSFARARQQAREQAERYQKEQEARIQRNKELRAQAMKRSSQIIKYRDIGAFSAPLLVTIGTAGTIFGAIGLSVELAAATPEGIGVAAVILVASLFALIRGIDKRKWRNKAKKYKSLCSQKMYCAVEDIASATGTDQKKVVKDIKKVLAKGFFPEGYIDEDGTTLMVSKSVYDQYVQTKKNQEMMAAEQEAKEAEMLQENGVDESAKVLLSPEQQAELNVMISEGNRSISRLHELNEQIPGEAITAKLEITENLLGDIFQRVKEHPEQMKNCHKLMDYHLPTMLKLVEAYAEYDKVSVPGPEIIKAKNEIEKTIDIINQAFTELLNRLFQDSVWDVTADAQVLKSMLNQEGLTKI